MTTETSILTPDRVEAIFIDCLYKEGEDTSGHIAAEGIVRTVGFKPERIEEHRQEIHDLLAELPDTFKESSGQGGWSFLEACVDRHGNQWTGMHLTMEQLVQLGIAIKEVEYLMPREMWGMLPGGMPYFTVKQ
ncbi:MAG: hypothetical protein ACREGE_01835 [Candidatus Microsaccharimonas sp.]